MDNHTNLVKIYLFVCDAYEKELKYFAQRFSNNHNPVFTDPEIMTIMLYCIAFEKQFSVKGIHRFASVWLRSWFPRLPSYQAFVARVNRLSEAFRRLLPPVIDATDDGDRAETICMIDSLPVITCSAKRCGKVAREVVDKGYCSTKSLYYYGVKLHLLGRRTAGRLPAVQALVVTPASESDLAVFRDNFSSISGRSVFADKAYIDKELHRTMSANCSELLTPVKYPRGYCNRLKKMFRAADDLLSRAVSSIRQPIESLFAWLSERSDIQRASRVRSTKGLLVHIFAKINAAFVTKLCLNY
jgi:hypothetical protein